MVDPTAQQTALEWIKALVPAMTAIFGGLWVAFEYVRNQKDAHLERFPFKWTIS
jgi:hypothetical protein